MVFCSLRYIESEPNFLSPWAYCYWLFIRRATCCLLFLSNREANWRSQFSAVNQTCYLVVSEPTSTCLRCNKHITIGAYGPVYRLMIMSFRLSRLHGAKATPLGTHNKLYSLLARKCLFYPPIWKHITRPRGFVNKITHRVSLCKNSYFHRRSSQDLLKLN